MSDLQVHWTVRSRVQLEDGAGLLRYWTEDGFTPVKGDAQQYQDVDQALRVMHVVGVECTKIGLHRCRVEVVQHEVQADGKRRVGPLYRLTLSCRSDGKPALSDE